MVSGSDYFENDGYKKAVARVETLVDSGSFSQLEAYVKDSGVVTGFALVDNRVCYVYSQFGPVNRAHASKIANVYNMAQAAGAPVIGLLDSNGMDISEGMDTLNAYGKIFKVMSDANGVIPQYSVVLGSCMGVAAVIAGLSDFTFAVKDTELFVQSPNTVSGVNPTDLGKLFKAHYHAENTGAVNMVFDDEKACLLGVKKFLSFMPLNNLEDTPVLLSNDESADVSYLESADSGKEVDVYKVIKAIADNGEYIEISGKWGKDIAVVFARVDGFSVAFLANNGPLSNAGIKKLIKTVTFCDAFNLPIVTLSNISAFDSDLVNQKDIILSASSLAYVFANSTVPKVNIILKNANGAAYMLFNSKFIGADLVYAWPNSNANLFEDEAAKAILHQDLPRLDSALQSGYIDMVIAPLETRKIIVTAIENLLTKRVFKHPKKHGSMCF
ncbi:MAG: hypothetical protein LBU94_01820 [Clostridiales bacterium]|jgi:acetyl-CoA carboxylase carboxyltransferase component|nr:hypothetical protein [Clostridiales bacterium]